MKTGIGQSKWSVFAVVFLTLILFSTGTVNSSVTITKKKRLELLNRNTKNTEIYNDYYKVFFFNRGEKNAKFFKVLPITQRKQNKSQPKILCLIPLAC